MAPAWWAAAASVLIILAVGTVWLLQPEGASELAMAYAQDHRSVDRVDRGEATATNEDLNDKALELLRTERPEDALDLLQVEPFLDPCTEARRQWLLALGHLMLDQKDAARPLLERVSASGCMLQNPASELLDDLR